MRATQGSTFLVAMAVLCGVGGPKVLKSQALNPAVPTCGAAGVRPQRIASVALASDTMLLRLLGAERVAAVSWVVDDGEYSPDAGHVPPQIPRLTGDPESVIALLPDLAVVAEYSTPGIGAALRAAGINTFELAAPQSLDAVLENLERLGACIGQLPRAVTWSNELRARVKAVETHAARRAPRRALIVESGFAQGLGTLADDLLTRLNATNPARQTRWQGGVALDAERLLAWQPHVVFVATADAPSAADPSTELRHLPGYALLQKSADWAPQVAGIARRALSAVSPLAVDALEAMDQALEQRRR